MATSPDQVARAVERFQAQVPTLARLRLVVELELTTAGLTGSAEPERFRVEVPGPKVTEVGDEGAEDARLQLSIPRTMFAVLAEEGELIDWKEALFYGHLKVEGDARVRRLLGQAIERSDAGARR